MLPAFENIVRNTANYTQVSKVAIIAPSGSPPKPSSLPGADSLVKRIGFNPIYPTTLNEDPIPGSYYANTRRKSVPHYQYFK